MKGGCYTGSVHVRQRTSLRDQLVVVAYTPRFNVEKDDSRAAKKTYIRQKTSLAAHHHGVAMPSSFHSAWFLSS